MEVLARLKGVRVSVEISTEAECFRHRSSYRAVGCGCSGAPASPTYVSSTSRTGNEAGINDFPVMV